MLTLDLSFNANPLNKLCSCIIWRWSEALFLNTINGSNMYENILKAEIAWNVSWFWRASRTSSCVDITDLSKALPMIFHGILFYRPRHACWQANTAMVWQYYLVCSTNQGMKSRIRHQTVQSDRSSQLSFLPQRSLLRNLMYQIWLSYQGLWPDHFWSYQYQCR